MPLVLSEVEHSVLLAFLANEKEDAEGAWNWFHHSISGAVRTAGRSELEADAICRNLRKRKLLIGQGTGKWATYYLSDHGREVITTPDSTP